MGICLLMYKYSVYCLVVDMDEPISHVPQPTPVQETALPWQPEPDSLTRTWSLFSSTPQVSAPKL